MGDVKGKKVGNVRHYFWTVKRLEMKETDRSVYGATLTE
jgi:hypothetical protein